MTTDTPDAAAVQAAIERRKQMLADSNDHDGGYPATPDGRLASILDLAVIAAACEHYQRDLAAALERAERLRKYDPLKTGCQWEDADDIAHAVHRACVAIMEGKTPAQEATNG